MFEKLKENWSKVAAPLVLIISILIVVIYSDSFFQKKRYYDVEQKLFHLGKTYEYEIKKGLDQYRSVAELLSISFSKEVEKNDFNVKAKALIKTVMAKHNMISSASFVLKTQTHKKNEEFLDLSDSLILQRVTLIKTEKGKIYEVFENEYQDLFIKAEIEKAVSKEQTRILSPIVKRIENKDVPLIPIVSSIFEGKRFIGYLVLYVNIDWKVETQQLIPEHEAFVSANDGKLISLKNDKIYLAENIGKVCFTCNALLRETENSYNFSLENNYLTLCFRANLQNSLNEWGICLRSDRSTFSGLVLERLIIWLLGGLTILIGILLLIFFNSKFEKPWNSVQKMVGRILSGEFDEEDYEKQGNKNLTNVKNALFSLNQSLNELDAYNQSAISGDFEKPLKINEFKHKIIRSSKSLYKHLEKTNEKLAKGSSEIKHITQVTENLDKIALVLKSHHKDMNALSEEVIKTLVDIMNIAMGAVFLSKQKDDEIWLEQTVSYAYQENKYQKKQFKLGESLVGACAAEKRIVHLNKIPENYLKIISGLGETSPKSLLIIPLIFEEEVLGVIELGSLSEFDKNAIHFAESAALSIASTLSLAQNNIRNTKLLEQTQVQTKELEEHERKMKEALAELKDLQGKTARSEAEIRAKLEAMNNTLMIVEYTTDGTLLDANYKFLNTMHYSLDEIKGNNVIELLKEEDREEFLRVINMVKSGNFYESIMRRHTKQGQEKWFMASYTPVFNDEGIVQNILFSGIDITRIRLNEEQLKVKVEELSSEIKNLKEK